MLNENLQLYKDQLTEIKKVDINSNLVFKSVKIY